MEHEIGVDPVLPHMYQHTSDSLKREACMSLYGLNPKHFVTCEVTKPSDKSDDLCNADHENKDIDPSPLVTGNGNVIPIVTHENYPNAGESNVPKVRCLSNHRGSKDVVRICNLLQKKIDTQVKSVSDVGIQVDPIDTQCDCKGIEKCSVSVQTDARESDLKCLSFDINFNWSN